MHDHTKDTVMVVCDDERYAADLLARLFDGGYSAVGPVPSAGVALAVVAHAYPTLAIVANPPTGRRGARELAVMLMRDWGIRSLILEGAGGSANCETDQDWRPRPDQILRLGQVLGPMGNQTGQGEPSA